ncbi:MAG: hypothetical protein JW929_12575 [Anaerolineales bacterium]|nr:hypothetical protein [Anaerolineales bacterium]
MLILWLLLNGLLGICSALYMPSVIANDSDYLAREYSGLFRVMSPQLRDFFPWVYKYRLVVIFLNSVVNLIAAWGLWTMRNWARIIILATQGYVLALGLFFLFLLIAASGGNLLVCGLSVVSLILPGWIFLWFFLNRRKFH